MRLPIGLAMMRIWYRGRNIIHQKLSGVCAIELLQGLFFFGDINLRPEFRTVIAQVTGITRFSMNHKPLLHAATWG